MNKLRQVMHGLFILDKPLGISSNKALQTVKRLLKVKKAGHTGSLDPLASGVLPICLGHATKLSQYLLDADKRYLATLTLGSCSTTGDAEGEISYCGDYQQLTVQQINTVVESFKGKSQQLPPMHSALKFNGQPLYKIARQGKNIDRASRSIEIYHIEIVDISLPQIVIDVHCSKGTYIRTLAEDIGKQLTCGAYLSGLRRTRAGAFMIEQSYRLEQLVDSAEHHEQLETFILPMDTLIQHYEAVHLNAEESNDLRFGRKIYSEMDESKFEQRQLVRLYDDKKLLLAIAEVQKEEEIEKISFQPKRVFL